MLLRCQYQEHQILKTGWQKMAYSQNHLYNLLTRWIKDYGRIDLLTIYPCKYYILLYWNILNDFFRPLVTILKYLEKTIHLSNVISIRKKLRDFYLNATFTIWILMGTWSMIKAPWLSLLVILQSDNYRMLRLIHICPWCLIKI